MGALDQLRGANGDGIIERARSNPRIVIAIAAGAVLLLAWIGWAIYVTSSNGAAAGLGVVIAWPAMLAALALISLPFIGGYLLIRRLSPSDGEATSTTADADESDAEEEDDEEEDEEASEEESDDSGDEEEDEQSDEEGDGSDEGDEEDEDADEDEDEESDSEAKAAKS